MNIIKKLGPVANVDFNKLFFGQLFSHFADAILQFLLIYFLMITYPDDIKTAMPMMFFFFMLPQFIFSPFAGAFCDRFSRKTILLVSCLYRALIIGVLAFSLQEIAINELYLYSCAIGCGAAFFYPAKMSIITNIVESAQLKFANALNSSLGAVAMLFGAFGANYLLSKIQLQYTFILVCSMYLIGAIFVSLIKLAIPQKRVEKQNENLLLIINYLKNHKRTRYLIYLSVTLQFIVAVFSNSLNSLIQTHYGLAFSDLTFIRTLLGVGIIAGMILVIYFARIVRTPHLLASSFVVFCIALFTAPLCTSMNIAWVWLIPIGIVDATILIMLDTILQKITPDRMRGKIFGLEMTLSTLSFLIGTYAVAHIVDNIHPLVVFRAIAFIAFVLAMLILVFDKSFRYFLLKAIIGNIFLSLYNYKIEGAENIPKTGKVLLAGNHTGHLDPLIIQMATRRQLWFVTGPVAFQIPIIRHLLKYFNVLPLEFGKGLEAIESGVKKLLAGEAVIIFPEGKFTSDGSLCKFNRGVGLMAQHANCPIVPFAIQGGFESWGKTRKLPKLFGTIVIQFGQPVTDTTRDEKEITKELRERVNFMKNSLERRSLYNINQNFYSNFLDLMQEKGDIYGQNVALSLKTKDGYEDVSYIEISRKAKKFANYLIENIQVQRNERIAIICESRPEFSIGMFASIQTGAIVVPLDIKLTVSEHTNILGDCNPRILLCSSHYLEHALEVKNNVSSIEHIFVLDDEERQNQDILSVNALEADIEKDLGRPRSLDETALIVYTSGTTGNPKGVMISFGNIYSQLRDFEQILKLSNKNSLLSILPLNHLLELNVGFFGVLYMGAKTVYIKSLNPKELSATMKERQVTHLILVPLVAKMLKNSIDKQIGKQSEKTQKIFKQMYKLAKYMPRFVRRIMFKSIIDGFGGKLECFVCGGAPLENDIAEFFNTIGVPVFQGYGLTETSPTISTNSYKHNKIGTVGLPLPSLKVKIAENGEILVAGANVMQGYYNKPEMTAEVIDEDGWFHTGDIGEIDKDGFIKITGRIKNMIVLGGGKKIFPEEVEAVLEASDLIKELCVMSVKIKSGNKEGTEEVGVVIVPSDELAKKTDEEIQKELEIEVKTLSQASLASYKIPSVVILHREELPKTSTRKVKRKELQDWYENQCQKV